MPITASSAASDTEIPGLDLGPYLRGEAGALEKLAGQLRYILENVGFFYLENHGIPQELIDRTFAASARVHALPAERKLEITVNRDNVGYMGLNQSMQKHSKVEVARRPNYNESFFCSRELAPDHPDLLAEKRFCGRNQWPRELPGFREDMLAYQPALDQLGMQMLPVMARALDLPADYFDQFFQPSRFSLRLLHYPKRDESVPDQYGTGAHTDGSFLTFLIQNGVAGLQIQRPDGVWLDAPVLPGKFLVNSGDMVKRWSNDRFLSTPHRVMNTSGKERYSIAFFFDMHLDTVIECLPTCHGPDNPPKYPPLVYGDYLSEFSNANYFQNHKKSTQPA